MVNLQKMVLVMVVFLMLFSVLNAISKETVLAEFGDKVITFEDLEEKLEAIPAMYRHS